MKTLRNVLLVNGLTSGATGMLLITFADSFAELFHAEQSAALFGIGVFLILFGIMVFSEGRSTSLNERRVIFISILDISWVLGSLIIVALQLFNLSVTGYLIIGAVAAWVALMAVLQLQGIRKMTVR